VLGEPAGCRVCVGSPLDGQWSDLHQLGLCNHRRGSGCPDCSHTCRTGRQMRHTILATLFGGNLTLLGSFRKLAAPCLAGASGTSRETLIPMMDMLPTRGNWHKSPCLAFYFCAFCHECAIVNSATPVSVASSAFRVWGLVHSYCRGRARSTSLAKPMTRRIVLQGV
jgi:hypothetical protein